MHSETQDYRSNVLLCMYICMTLVALSGVSCMLVVQVKERGITYSCTVK